MGIVILFEPLGTLRGYYNNFQRNRFIHINSDLSESEQRVVCGHELGHAVQHKGLNICFLESNTYFVKNKFEREANLFAAHLLFTDEVLNRYYENNFTIEQIANAENVSSELLKLII